VSPYSIIRPAYMMATRSHVSAITLRSWQIKIIERASSRFKRSRSSRIWAWIMTSSAVTGSSAMTLLGLHASAIATITRCPLPPAAQEPDLRQGGIVRPSASDRSGDYSTVVAGEAHERACGGPLPPSALSRQAQRLPFVECERDTVDGVYGTLLRRILNDAVL